MRVRHGLGVAILLALAVSGAGCAPEATPEPTPTGFATEEEAFAAAEATYRAYVDALNQVDLSNPDTFEEVYRWTTGEANANDREFFSQMHADEWSVSGDTVAGSVAPGQLDLPHGVSLSVCQDVSAVRVVDSAGASQVSPERPAVQAMTVTLSPSELTPTHWVISNFSGRDGDPAC